MSGGRQDTETQELATLTVRLIPKAEEDLSALMQITGLSKTDVTNRAISLYRFVADELEQGGQFLVRRGREVFLVKLE